jgi:hypothetical protein
MNQLLCSGLTFLALFAVFQNLDNLVLAAAYRCQGIQIRWASSCFIGSLSGVFTAAALFTARLAKSQAFWLVVYRYAEVLGRVQNRHARSKKAAFPRPRRSMRTI